MCIHFSELPLLKCSKKVAFLERLSWPKQRIPVGLKDALFYTFGRGRYASVTAQNKIMLQCTYATCMKPVKYIKTYFQMKETLDFDVSWNFKPIRTWIGNIIEKIKNNFSHLHL